MRKIGFYLLILLAMVMVISCGNDKKSDKRMLLPRKWKQKKVKRRLMLIQHPT